MICVSFVYFWPLISNTFAVKPHRAVADCIASNIWSARLMLLPLSIKYCIWRLAVAPSWLHWSHGSIMMTQLPPGKQCHLDFPPKLYISNFGDRKGWSTINYCQSSAFDHPYLSCNDHCDWWVFHEIFIIIS